MSQFFKKYWEKALNWCLELLFPTLCQLCNKPGELLCPNCLKSLGKRASFITGARLYRLKKVSRTFEREISGVWYFWDYKNPAVKKIIHLYKFGQVKDLGFIFRQMFDRFFKDFQGVEIVPIAPNRKRLKARGFDHIKQMLPPDLVSQNVRLFRIKNTLSQTQTVGFRERWENLRGAFKSIIQNRTKTKTIFLVDDILTSGATAAWAAKSLRQRANKIYLIVLARG